MARHGFSLLILFCFFFLIRFLFESSTICFAVCLFPFFFNKRIVVAVGFVERDGDAETELDGLGVRMRFLEFLRGVLEVLAERLDVVHELLVTHVETLVVIEVLVLELGVELPCEGLGSAHDNPQSVVVDRTGVVIGFTKQK